MDFSKMKHIIYASLFFALIFISANVNAETFDFDARIDQNNKMIDSANSMGSIYRSSYLDLSLKELKEANYTALTQAQQEKYKEVANETILEGNGNNLSNSEKLEKFYDWILDKYYYYETPEKIIGLSTDNRQDNGYAATLVALARTQNIPARLVGGYYNQNARDEYNEWQYNEIDRNINHLWVEAYVNGMWRMYDPFADSYKEYDELSGQYIDRLDSTEEVENEEIQASAEQQNNNDSSTETTDEYQKKYFNPSTENLSKTHIAFKTYSGSNNVKYISNNTERSVLKSFLNTNSNGKKINNSYNTSNSSTWFVKNDTNSITDGYGKTKRIYWPAKKSLQGSIVLNSFTALENITLSDNKITKASITGAKSLKKVNIKNNQITKIVITGSKKINSIKAENNPATYIEYNFAPTKQKAILKAGKGGTISVNYAKTDSGRKHYLKAKPNSDYQFVGWYKGTKRISKKANYTLTKSSSFTYVAKFKKKPPAPYIKISISKQKLWYYKYGTLKYTSYVVTGQRYTHDTPTGIFKIRGKARDVYLIGPDYKSFVNYWMPIYGDIGLHDATWRWSFGGDIYTYNGSHGCINLPFATAKYIYNNVPTGTTVKVVK